MRQTRRQSFLQCIGFSSGLIICGFTPIAIITAIGIHHGSDPLSLGIIAVFAGFCGGMFGLCGGMTLAEIADRRITTWYEHKEALRGASKLPVNQLLRASMDTDLLRVATSCESSLLRSID